MCTRERERHEVWKVSSIHQLFFIVLQTRKDTLLVSDWFRSDTQPNSSLKEASFMVKLVNHQLPF